LPVVSLLSAPVFRSIKVRAKSTGPHNGAF
jgi:hypothetical protein